MRDRLINNLGLTFVLVAEHAFFLLQTLTLGTDAFVTRFTGLRACAFLFSHEGSFAFWNVRCLRMFSLRVKARVMGFDIALPIRVALHVTEVKMESK